MKKYFEPAMEFVKFSQVDILASSSVTTKSYQPITDESGDQWTPWTPRPTRRP